MNAGMEESPVRGALRVRLDDSAVRSSSDTLKVLSSIVRKPADQDWRHAKIPDLRGWPFDPTGTTGRIDFYPESYFMFPWPALGFKGSGWNGVIEKTRIHRHFFEFTVRFSQGESSFTRVFQIGRYGRELSGIGKHAGKTFTVRDIDPFLGVRALKELMGDPMQFQVMALAESFPKLTGLRLGVTNSAGRIDITFSRGVTYHWPVLGRAQAGWEAVITGQRQKGEILEIIVTLRKGNKRIRRTFQIHPGLSRLLEPRGKSVKGAVPLEVLEMSDCLGREAVSRLLRKPADFDWASEAENLPDPAGLYLGETNKSGYLSLNIYPHFDFAWPVLRTRGKGWKAVIVKGEVQNGRYELTVRLSKGKRSVTRIFQIGRYTRLLRGGKEAKSQTREALDISDELGLRPLLRIVADRFLLDPEELSSMAGLRLGKTSRQGQIIFRPIPHYEFHWAVLGSYEDGWEAAIARAWMSGGYVRLAVRLTKEGQPPRERTFLAGPLRRALRHADGERLTAPSREVFELTHFETVVGLIEPEVNGANRGAYNFRSEKSEAVDSAQDASDLAGVAEVFGELERILGLMPPASREIAGLLLAGQGEEAVVAMNGFSLAEVRGVRAQLRDGLGHFYPEYQGVNSGLEEGTHLAIYA